MKSGHEATWVQVPEFESGTVGQYYCSKCKLELDIGYNQHYIESCIGWHWKIRDSSGQVVDSAGNKHASKYEPDIGALDEIKEEGLRRFDSIPCLRSN